jgi:hypothetical protein
VARFRTAGSEIRHRSPPAAEQFFVTAERAISFITWSLPRDGTPENSRKLRPIWRAARDAQWS